MKICIYPGGFDPFHKGHADVIVQAAAALQMGKEDKFIVVPDPRCKEGSNSSLEQRNRMIDITAAEIRKKIKSEIKVFNPYGHVTEDEISDITASNSSYMKVAVPRIKEKYPDADFHMVMGADRFLALKERGSGALRENIVVVTREGQSDIDEVTNAVADETLVKKPVVITGKFQDASATAVRQNISGNGGYDEIRDLISENLYKFIINQGLYQNRIKEEKQ